MFAQKLIVIAAAVALAVANVAAVEEATLIKVHISKHHHMKQEATNETLGGEGDELDVNVDVYESGSGSWSDDSGADDDDASASGSGSYGEWTTPEGEGGDEDDVVDIYCDGDDASQMSVEGVEGVFCVSGQACVADILGACPGPQDGLEFGAYCGTVQSGVYGCLPYTETPVCTGEGESEMSVEGVEGVFCVTGDACAGVEGACPEAQDGLEYGSFCGLVDTGVYGCKPNDAKHHKKGHFGKKPAHYKRTQFKPAHVKAAAHHKKVTVKKPVVHKKVEVKKPVAKKPVVHKKVEVKKPVVHKKVEVKKVEHKKVEVKKPVVHKKVEAKRPVAKKPVVHKVEIKKPVVHKKVEHKKPAADAKKTEHKH